MGQHYDTLDEHAKHQTQRWFWASMWLYYLALGLTKLSVLVQYLRIFPTNHRLRSLCLGLIAIVVAHTIWAILSAIVACKPVAFFWDPTKPGGRCLDRTAVWYA